ncbi:MAG: restriction endonuclease subunit S [Ignavibacteriales bacterium]|nr:MAG: restriction endonuclease subunit S [Ignavibacteriales bacterium]
MNTNSNGWHIKSLAEICKITTGDKDVNEGDVNGDYPFFTCAAEPLRSVSHSFDGESILLPGNGANVGLVLYYNGKFEAYQRTYVLNNFSADVKYVFFHLRDRWKKSQENKQFGSATNYIRYDNIASYKIPLPPLPIQKQIAEILEKADEAKQKRKEANKLTDEFLQSVFIEMFGDPVKNPNGFKVVTIGDVISEVRDGPHVSPNYVNNGIPILSTRNVRPGLLLLDDIKYVSEEHYNYLTRNFKPRKGDVLLTKGGTTGYAKVVDFEWPFCVWVHIAVLRPKSIIHPRYLESALNSDHCYQQSQLYTHGIANHDLGLTRLIKIKLLLPPYELQQQFAEIVNKTEALKEKQKQSEQELENLFQSLMQKAFKGQLV